MVQPFLKWAGGKRWLVQNHEELFDKPFDRYIEPFLGSGAVFFHLKPKNAILSDVNGKLIECYKAIRDNYQLVEKHLAKHQNHHSKPYYYEIRGAQFRSRYQRAAQFLYLNRTCWNGLYRENMKGEFNVPIGTKNKVLLDSDDFAATAELLQFADLRVSDFEGPINEAREGDFLFVDPPYTVAHNCNGFVKYNQRIFSWEDQERLSRALIEACKRGASIILTNAAHNSVEQLYEGEERKRIDRSSVISGKPSGRVATQELLVTFNS